MKILSAQQVREADAYTMTHEPVASINLMERAAKACADWIRNYLNSYHHFIIFCGTGNNGGDGLALARMLYEYGNRVEVFIVRYSDSFSHDFEVNRRRLEEFPGIPQFEITGTNFPTSFAFHKTTVVVDALFGSGLNRPVEGLAANVIGSINNSGCKTVSIDVPSGLFCDKVLPAKAACVKADYTLTFQQPKLSFMFPSCGEFTGEFFVLDIGLDKNFTEQAPSKYFYLDEEMILPIYRPRKKFSHKGTYGHALLVSGSYGKMGAAVLCARACLRAGVGLLTVHIPQCGYNVIQTSVPEAMAEIDEGEDHITGFIDSAKYDAIGVGPGIGQDKQTQGALKLLVQNCPVPLVLDADALNIISENKTWLGFLPESSILTPHPKEFERLAGKWSSDEERLHMQMEFSFKNKAYVVLKGAHTSISCPDGEVFFNSTGNPGMATAGAGDVLTGIITGLFAQGYDSKQAAVFGVYLHGLAGDIAAKKYSQEAMLSGDILGELGEAFKTLK